MILRILKWVFRKIVWGFCWLIPVKKNKIYVSSFYGKGYGGNPKYIVEQLLKKNIKYKIIWLINEKKYSDSLPKGVHPCLKKSFKRIYHMATSKIWIDNCRKSYEYKKSSQYYIQTWHGFALKQIENDVEDKLSADYVKMAKKDSKAIDLIISEGKHMTEIYKRAFWYDGKIVEWGSPRNDVIINDERSEKVLSKVMDYYNIKNKKIILYAPTFRNNNDMSTYKIDFAAVIKACEVKFKSNFIMCIRLHPNISDKSNELNLNCENIIDVTLYPDIQELLCAASIVISDYSSLMFDFALSYKPCFQFATDIEDYKNDRNFYFDIENLPFDLARTNEELIDKINNFDQEKYSERLSQYFENVGIVREGNSSEKCVELIEKIVSL